MFLPALIMALAAGESFPMTRGEQTRDFIYVADVVDALLRSAKCREGQLLNIGSGTPVALAEVARKVGELMKRTHLIQLGALEYRPAEIMSYFVDHSLARQILGWLPRVSLDEGLANTVREYSGGVQVS